jgi:purine-binding chemotaxis protein CheW
MLPANDSGDDYLLARVGDEYCAILGSAIREVVRWRAPTPVPGAPAVLPGIISQRGLVLPVADLRLLLGFSATPPDRHTRLVIVQQGAVDLALLVDAALDLQRLTAEERATPPAGLNPARSRLLSAVAQPAGAPLLVLDLVALIAALQEAS